MTKTYDDLLLTLGLAPSRYFLDINRRLSVPPDMVLPSPWNLPSRLFQFPIEIGDATEEGSRAIGLMHPLLSNHPFVRRVAAQLGVDLDPNGAPNAQGVSGQSTGSWWHAVDLVTAGKWRELIETQRFTTNDDIAGAVVFGLDYSPHDTVREGHLGVGEARELMLAIGSHAPGDREALLLDMAAPQSCRGEIGAERWPINSRHGADAESRAWGRIFGVECGWFTYDRSGYLQWSQTGRDRHAAAGASTFTESATGQAAFAF